MTAAALLDRLDNVRSRGIGQWIATCPAHYPDKTPSLSVREGERGLLLHCFAGCEKPAIVEAIGLTMVDLFFDAPGFRTTRRERMRCTQARQRKTQRDEVNGFTIDALREADYFVRSRQDLDISAWTHERLNDELDALAEAHALLWAEECASWT